MDKIEEEEKLLKTNMQPKQRVVENQVEYCAAERNGIPVHIA